MKTTILATDITDVKNRRNISIEDFSRCSLCHFDIQPVHVASFFYLDKEGSFRKNALYSLFSCPRCKQVMMRKSLIYDGYDNRLTEHDGATFYPHTPSYTKFSDAISKLSPQFV